jgi:hypothetical protein
MIDVIILIWSTCVIVDERRMHRPIIVDVRRRLLAIDYTVLASFAFVGGRASETETRGSELVVVCSPSPLGGSAGERSCAKRVAELAQSYVIMVKSSFFFFFALIWSDL